MSDVEATATPALSGKANRALADIEGKINEAIGSRDAQGAENPEVGSP